MRKRVIERHRREDLERRFNENPASIDKTWASFFTSLGKRERLSMIFCWHIMAISTGP